MSYCYAISFPNSKITEQAWQEAFAKAKLHRVELSCKGIPTDEQLTAIQELIAKKAIDVASFHIPFGEMWNIASTDPAVHLYAVTKIQEFLSKTAAFGVKNYTLHASAEPMPTEPPKREACILAFRQAIAELLPILQQHGMSLNVELLPRTCLGNSAEELQDMLNGFPENIGICVDVNHLCGHPETLPKTIAKLASRVRTLHLSDYDGADECHWYPGMGVLDWPAIMDEVRKLPHDVALIFECFGFLNVPWDAPGRNSFEEVKLRTYERNVFFVENAAELQKRIREQTIR